MDLGVQIEFRDYTEDSQSNPEYWDADNEEYIGPDVPEDIDEDNLSLGGLANILSGISKGDQVFLYSIYVQVNN